MEGETYHIPALLPEAINGLNIREAGVYVDATFGGGGHSAAILAALGSEGRLFGFDRDTDALANAPADSRFTFVHSNFRYISNFMRYHGVEHVDGILADLGVSFHHFDTADRGFSFRSDAPLDMRMNRNGGKTAADILADYPEEELSRLFRTYTDLKNPRALTSAIVRARAEAPVDTTFRLVEAAHLTPDSQGHFLEFFINSKAFLSGRSDALP
jgi:16S rRNA (cytosine1402-N4)-methyltransferase